MVRAVHSSECFANHSSLYIIGVTAPIVGTTSLEHLEEMLGTYRLLVLFEMAVDSISGALNVNLTDEETKYLEELYKPQSVWTKSDVVVIKG